MITNELETQELDLAAKLASFDEALKDGSATEPDSDPELRRAQECLRMMEQFWPRHPDNAPTPLKIVLCSPDPKLREQIGRFRVIREIGRGGFGIVYLALDPQLKRDVAVKVPRSDVLISAELRQRFQREARAAAGLEHPNLVPVYETGEDDSLCYIVSAYCPGINLAEWLHEQTEPVPLNDAAELAATLADAVQHAHDRGVLHRDLKPANVLLQGADGGTGSGRQGDMETRGLGDKGSADSGSLSPSPPVPLSPRPPALLSKSSLGKLVPKVTDFGLAKLADADLQTHSGATMGTPSYMAPEQAVQNGPPVGPAADIYSLGVILYELLTGRPPFVTGSPLETLLLVQNEEPVPPSRLRHRLPRDLETICLKCLEKEPSRRYRRAGDLAADLNRFLAGEPIHARPLSLVGRTIRRARRHPVAVMFLALFIAALIVGVAGISWQWWRADANARQADANASQALASSIQAAKDRDIAIAERKQTERMLEQTEAALDRLTKLGEGLIGKPETDKTGNQVMKEVLVAYQAILKERSDDPEVRFRTAEASHKVAMIYLHMQRWRECDGAFRRSFEILDRLRKEDPAQYKYRSLMCQCLVWHGHSFRDRGMYKEAIASYVKAIDLAGETLKEHPERKGLISLRANALINCAGPLRVEQRWDESQRFQEEALELQRKLVADSPPKSTYHGELALGLESYAVSLWQQGKAKEAEAPCRESLALREELHGHGVKISGGVRYLARIYTDLGCILDSQNRVEESKQAHQKAIELLKRLNTELPNDVLYQDALVSALLHLADLYANHGSPGEAHAVFAEALAVPPHSAGKMNDVAYHLVLSKDPRAHDADTALPLALKAVKQVPKSGNFWNTLGVVYYRHGDWDKAIEAMNKATSLRGAYAGDTIFIAMAHARKGDWPKAREWFERAKQSARMQPRDMEVQQFLAEAEELMAKAPKK